MSAPGFFISPSNLWAAIGGTHAPQIIDVRRREVFATAPGVLPTATWRDPDGDAGWMAALDRSRPVVVTCKLGHNLSQGIGAALRAEGVAAQVLEGGYAGWLEAGLPLVDRAALERLASRRPSLWVTRRRPKIDRIACPWLIRRFIDPQARFLFVDPAEVANVARDTGAVAFDIEGAELGHQGERCSFDAMLRVFGLEAEPALAQVALVVGAADTGRPDLAPEAAGLLAISRGLSAGAGDDDHALLRQGFVLYDGLFAWARVAVQQQGHRPAKAA
jgi:rhodanese-related sulfurtransferase